MRIHNWILRKNSGKAFGLWKFQTNTKIKYGEQVETPFQQNSTLPEKLSVRTQHMTNALQPLRTRCMLFGVE